MYQDVKCEECGAVVGKSWLVSNIKIVCPECVTKQLELRKRIENIKTEAYIENETDTICIKISDFATSTKKALIIKLEESDLFEVEEGNCIPCRRLTK